MQEMWVRSLGWEDPLEKELGSDSSILAWRIPWTEKPGGLQSTGSQKSRTQLKTTRTIYAMLGNEVEHPNSTACYRKAIVNSSQPVPMISPLHLWTHLCFPTRTHGPQGWTSAGWGQGGRQWIRTTGWAWCVFLNGGFLGLMPWLIWQCVHSASLLTETSLGTSCLPDTTVGMGIQGDRSRPTLLPSWRFHTLGSVERCLQ